MNKDNLSLLFIEEFPEYSSVFIEHINFNEELLNHVFFGEINDFILDLLDKDHDPILIQKLFDFYEQMEVTGDTYVKNVLSCTILERIGDDPKILETAYKYMGRSTRNESDVVEKGLGRK